mgnify:CR=1 FL=1
MFPAHAGMTRGKGSRKKEPRRVPRARGDDPPMALAMLANLAVFPAHAGMTRMID